MTPRPAQANPKTFAGRIGATIRARRIKLGLSAEQAAGRASAFGRPVPRPTWYNWEKGRHLPLERLPAIARALKCRPRDLLPE